MKDTRGIEQIIRQAMEEGAFDNLPGNGRPLTLDENPYLDPEWQLAHHLLRQNGFAPEFVERRQAIELELAAAREALARTWAWRQQGLKQGKPTDWVEAEWRRATTKFAEKVGEINILIRDYNLQIPNPLLHRSPIAVEDELSKL
jgi:hypothetical protein